jgi:hypothetical protein
MRAFLRKCRGTLGMGAIWSVAWAGIFAAIWVVVGIVDPDSIDPGEGPLGVARIGAIFGFVSGIAFGVTLAMADGRKVLRSLSVGRAALWGAIGTAAFPLLTAVNNSMLIFVCPIGAALAAGSVAIAKRAQLRAPPNPSRRMLP